MSATTKDRATPTFMQRLFIILWLVIASASVYGLGSTYKAASSEVFPSRGYVPDGAFKVGEGVVDAYREGRMTADAARAFESDLRRGLVTPPSGQVVFVKSPAGFSGEASVWLQITITLCVAVGGIQYLLLGYANPAKLLTRKPSA